MSTRGFKVGCALVLSLAMPMYAASGLAQGEPPPADLSVLTYHGDADRSGNFIVPTLTWERARSLRLDQSFHAQVSGHVYAQPLYWRPPGAAAGQLLVATESDNIYALDAATGNEIWRRSLGKPVALSSLPCGNIDPLGITGTPVIDAPTQSIYLDAAVTGPAGPRHLIFGLSLKDGSPRPGWPIDVADALQAKHQTFNPAEQNERGALTIVQGRLYVPFGGHYGDCGQYHGWVVGISLDNPTNIVSWTTRARGGGIWAPGGISSDGKSLFAATGNTFDASTWSDGEGVFRLPPDLQRSDKTLDYFAPSDWYELDQRDADLGGTNPIPFEGPTGTGIRAFVLALGKDGRAYLLDRNDLGGIGGALAVETVSPHPIRTSPAEYRTTDGGVFIAFQGEGAHCPTTRDKGLTVLQIHTGTPPTIATAWCGAVSGAGSPIVTTTDGHSNPIVWILGAEGDNRLHGFRGDTGEPLFNSPANAMTGLRHFQTLIAVENRLYVGADEGVYAFSF